MGWEKWVFLAGFILVVGGIVLSFWPTREDLSLACTAFGATFFGVACLLNKFSLANIGFASMSFGIAGGVVVVAAIKERKDRDGKLAE